jgi:hypothetical protein
MTLQKPGHSRASFYATSVARTAKHSAQSWRGASNWSVEMKQKYDGPLIGDALLRARTALLEGEAVEVDGCTLYPDKDAGLIWGVDPYGQDCIAADGIDENSCAMALTWIGNASNTTGHRAEFSY